MDKNARCNYILSISFHFQYKDTQRLKMDGERYSRNCKHKKVRIVTLMLTKINFKTTYIVLLKQKRDVS